MNAMSFDKSLFSLVAINHADGAETRIFTNASLCVELLHRSVAGSSARFEYSAEQAFALSKSIAEHAAWILGGANGQGPKRYVDEGNSAYVCGMRSLDGKLQFEALIGNPDQPVPAALQTFMIDAESGKGVALGLVAAAIELLTVEAASDGMLG